MKTTAALVGALALAAWAVPATAADEVKLTVDTAGIELASRAPIRTGGGSGITI